MSRSLLSLTTALTLCGSGVLATAQAQAFNWQAQKGKTISVSVVKSPWSDILQDRVQDFEKLSGIKVNLSVLPEQQARQKLAIDFASGGRTVDVFDSSLTVEKARFAQAGWYEPLNKYMVEGKLDPTYRFDDFFTSARTAVKTTDGRIIGLPWKADVQVLYYRKDLFAQAGLKVPTTLDELEAAAAKLHVPGKMYGYAARGLKNANAYTYAFPLQAFGGKWVDSKGNSTVNSAQGVKALNWYSAMLKKYAPPSVVSYNWSEVLGLFQQEQLAMFNDGIGFAVQLEDKTKSKVAGKVGYAVLPGRLAPATYNALAMSSRSGNKDAAFLFMQWATNRAFDKNLVENGVTSPRQSSWTAASNKPLETIPWAKTYFDALKVAKPAFPEVPPVQEMRDTVGIAIVQSIQGAASKPALDQANRDFQTALDSAK